MFCLPEPGLRSFFCCFAYQGLLFVFILFSGPPPSTRQKNAHSSPGPDNVRVSCRAPTPRRNFLEFVDRRARQIILSASVGEPPAHPIDLIPVDPSTSQNVLLRFAPPAFRLRFPSPVFHLLRVSCFPSAFPVSCFPSLGVLTICYTVSACSY